MKKKLETLMYVALPPLMLIAIMFLFTLVNDVPVSKFVFAGLICLAMIFMMLRLNKRKPQALPTMSVMLIMACSYIDIILLADFTIELKIMAAIMLCIVVLIGLIVVVRCK